MCGICGIVDFKGRKISKESIKIMTNSMVHRGPDDEGYLISDNVGIGMRRLSIIDLEKGQQPISNEDDSISIVLNGEIYNHIELRKELLKKGHVFKTNSDTEVIVHLYEEYGYKSLQKINGMFAFAILDKQKKLLWIARDRLGIKPLYYALIQDKFLFSSDLNSISKNKQFSIDSESLIKFFGLAYVPTPRTIYEGIEKLPPAHYLLIKNSKITKKKYWQLPNQVYWREDINQAKEEFLSLINDSIRLRFRSDVPLGLFLSGGIDSSALVALASHLGFKDLNTLTINFIGKNGNDNLFAKIVSSKYQTSHSEVEFDLIDFKKELDDLMPYLDEPITDSAIVPTFVLSKIAHDQGIKVLLSGAGGDEIFGGYARHHYPRFGSPRWVAENFPKSIRNVISKLWTRVQPQRGIRAISPAIAYGLECSGSDVFFINQIMRDKNSINNILSNVEEQFIDLTNENNNNYTNKRMKLDLQNYLLDDVLSLTDKATMAASVEGRVPLLDHRVVEFAFSIPSEMNQLNSKAKGLFRESLKNVLPNEILNRKKEGFNAPTSHWMVDSVNSKIKEELLDSIDPILQDIIDIDLLEKLFSNKNNIKTAGHSIFGLYMLNRWLKINYRKTI